jgi:NADH-quinone oxidoreductase subunit L
MSASWSTADRDDDGGGDLRVADGAHLHDRLHAGRPGYQRFFSYISLFTFSMLMLVMSNNFLQLFFGWEAVGLVSYLLIGFWFKRPTAIFANMKAFLVNRVGDFGFILGIAGVLCCSARWTTRTCSQAACGDRAQLQIGGRSLQLLGR